MNIYNELLYIFLSKKIKYINILNHYCKIKFMTQLNKHWAEFDDQTYNLINNILDSAQNIQDKENNILLINQYESEHILFDNEKSYFIEEFKKGNNDALHEYMRLSHKFYHFLDAQKNGDGIGTPYLTALDDIKNGDKQHHWVWYVFPVQLGKYPGTSHMFFKFALKDDQEVQDYYNHPILRNRLIEITTQLYNLNIIIIKEETIKEIMGSIDITKLKICMEIFSDATNNKLFRNVLEKYY